MQGRMQENAEIREMRDARVSRKLVEEVGRKLVEELVEVSRM
jgi:hypothetical protein